MSIKPQYAIHRYTSELCRLESQSIVECRLQSGEIASVLTVYAHAVPEEITPVDGEVKYSGKVYLTVVYRDLDGEGIAMLLSASGYDSSNPISIAVGFNSEGKIEKCYVISCTGETSGIGTKVKNESFLSQFDGKGDVGGVDTISGATISSSAFLDAIKDAFAIVSTVNVDAEVEK